MSDFFEIAKGIVRADARRLAINSGMAVTVCAWCRHECFDHKPVRLLSDAEYRQVQSHGICLACKAAQLGTKRLADDVMKVNLTERK